MMKSSLRQSYHFSSVLLNMRSNSINWTPPPILSFMCPKLVFKFPSNEILLGHQLDLDSGWPNSAGRPSWWLETIAPRHDAFASCAPVVAKHILCGGRTETVWCESFGIVTEQWITSMWKRIVAVSKKKVKDKQLGEKLQPWSLSGFEHLHSLFFYAQSKKSPPPPPLK